jgi:hypothetical protein
MAFHPYHQHEWTAEQQDSLIVTILDISQLAIHIGTVRRCGVVIMSQQESKFGFTAFAETWNGRLAMLGFVIGVATELLTGQGILSQIGLM